MGLILVVKLDRVSAGRELKTTLCPTTGAAVGPERNQREKWIHWPLFCPTALFYCNYYYCCYNFGLDFLYVVLLWIRGHELCVAGVVAACPGTRHTGHALGTLFWGHVVCRLVDMAAGQCMLGIIRSIRCLVVAEWVQLIYLSSTLLLVYSSPSSVSVTLTMALNINAGIFLLIAFHIFSSVWEVGRILNKFQEKSKNLLISSSLENRKIRNRIFI